ncbi:hypothetical protein AB9B37_19885 [Escherichia coli]|uniref:hypothetical protein n=1 Tax=Escherichia coli TaxID=562 RepID=UPI0034775E99
MVQRYELELYHCNGGEMEPCDEGGYVEYEDYAELERKLCNFAAQVLYSPCSKVTEEMACEILGI